MSAARPRSIAVGGGAARPKPALGWPGGVARADAGGRGRRSSPMTWRWGDRLVLLAAWGAGTALCVISAAIVLYMGYRGIQYVRPDLVFSHPAAAARRRK